MPSDLTRLSSTLADRYRIERELGQGGMATVYLAEDLRHHRQVAIKVLKPELAAVLGADRFVQEITTTAQLQHPHILPLFDSGTADGFLFYVMPYIEGETLRDRLNRETQLGVDEAVRITREVADALDYAHRHGVVHRDIKPENILLHDGRPMVADFGIALAVSAAAGGRMTETGLSLGTPHYMSPEQATAEKTITSRSDTYSLGAVLYEMLTGQPPHLGGSAQQIIMKIVTEEVAPVTKLRKSVPPNVAAAVAMALEKLPADRFESTKAFAAALSDPGFARPGEADGAPLGAGARLSRTRRAAEAILSVVAIAGIAGTIYFGTRKSPEPGLTRFIAALPDSVQLLPAGSPMALSPDGRELVMTGVPRGLGFEGRRLYLRRMDDPNTEEIRGTKGAIDPSFSPDGQWVLFRRDSDLVKVPVVGGTAVRVVSVDGPSGWSWGDDGRVAYVRGTNDADLWTVSSDGGGARQVTKGVRFVEPDMLPGGRGVLGVIPKSPTDSSELVLASVADGTITDLGVRGVAPHYVSPGQIVFYRSDGTVLAVPFSPARRAITGVPVPILEGVAESGSGGLPVAVARGAAVLAYVKGSLAGEKFAIYAVTPRGKEQRLAPAPESFHGPRLSPDGRHVVVRIGGVAGGGDLWVYELATGARVRLTTNDRSRRPEWMPGGKRIAFLTVRDTAAHESFVSRPWDLSQGESLLIDRTPHNGGALQELSMGPAHTWAAIRVGLRSRTQGADIWIAPNDSLAAMRPLLHSAAWEIEPRVSHDGRMLAYTSNESGNDEVYVTPLPGPGPHVIVSVGGGDEPVWSRDDKSLYYRAPGHLMVATIEAAARPRVMRRDTLFADIYQRYSGFPAYDVFPDGRLLMIRAPRSTAGTTGNVVNVVVVINWQRMLEKKGATP